MNKSDYIEQETQGAVKTCVALRDAQTVAT